MRLRVYACTRLRVYTSTSLRAYYTCVCRAESRNRLTIPCNDAMAGNTGWHCHPVIGYRSANTLPGKMCYDHSYKLGTTTTTIFFVCVSVCLRCFFLLYEVGVCPCLCLLYMYTYIDITYICQYIHTKIMNYIQAKRKMVIEGSWAEVNWKLTVDKLLSPS